eukprot:11543947-Prorocentrum_lima.AAC.1
MEPHMKGVFVGGMSCKPAWVRSMSISYGGKTPAEVAFGRRPPDIVHTENMDPGQLSSEMLKEDKTHQRVQELAQKSHLEACQR